MSKGRGVGDGSTLDMNYFLGMSGGVLVADFESFENTTGVGGNNNPVSGTTTSGERALVSRGRDVRRFGLESSISTAVWKAPRPRRATPRFDSILHFGIGSALSQMTAPPAASSTVRSTRSGSGTVP